MSGMKRKADPEVFERSERALKRTLDKLSEYEKVRVCRSWIGCPCVCWHKHRAHTKEGCRECNKSVPQATWKEQQAVAVWQKWRTDDSRDGRVRHDPIYNA